MEKDYEEYRSCINNMLEEDKIFEVLENVKCVGKFVLGEENNWEPLDYAGYTFITPPLREDANNLDTYRLIQTVKRELAKHINLDKAVEAPDNALHVTIARLISGEKYLSDLKDKNEKKFLQYFNSLFSRLIISGQLSFEIKGVTVFSNGIIAAVISPIERNDYICLQSLRDYIYLDKKVCMFGVERKRSFLGHITLFYIEKNLEDIEKEKILASILAINEKYFKSLAPFIIKRAEIRKFYNYLSFDREIDWPVFELI